MSLQGKVVLVTGGGKGVGRGITESFVLEGATVIVCGRNPVDSLPDRTTFMACDVRDDDAVRSLVDGIVAEFGRLDIAVNNAGGSPPADSATASPRFTTSIIGLNLIGPLFVCQHAHRAMADGGLIINIGSVSGMRPTPQTVAYGAAKAGLLSMTQTLAMEWAPRVRVNMVTAGLVKTEKADLFYGDATGVARVEATVPMQRMASPRDVGDACVLLASPRAAYITGANLVLHGGGERPPFWDAAE